MSGLVSYTPCCQVSVPAGLASWLFSPNFLPWAAKWQPPQVLLTKRQPLPAGSTPPRLVRCLHMAQLAWCTIFGVSWLTQLVKDQWALSTGPWSIIMVLPLVKLIGAHSFGLGLSVQPVSGLLRPGLFYVWAINGPGLSAQSMHGFSLPKNHSPNLYMLFSLG